MKVQVLKRMVSLGKILEVGDIVDATGWRHVKALESNRYIKVLKDEPVEAPVESKPKKASKKAAAEEVEGA